MSISDTEQLKKLFFNFENTLMEKSVLVGVAPDSLVGVSLDPTFYDNDEISEIKCLISIDITSDEDIDDAMLESISDTVSDYLKHKCELKEKLAAIGIDFNQLNWWPVDVRRV